MRFQYSISEDLERLTLSLPEGETLDEDTTEDEVFEALTANTSLQMIPEGTVGGDITSAPCIGFLSSEEIGKGGFGTNALDVGFWDGSPQRQRVIARWGWMSYAVHDLSDYLREEGTAVFHGGLVMPAAVDLELGTEGFREDLFAALTETKLAFWHDKVSELVEDPDCDLKKLRKATAHLLMRLNVLDNTKRKTLIKLLQL